MEKNRIAEQIVEEVKALVGTTTEVKLQETMKNNGQLLTGILIHEQGSSVSPCYYIDWDIARVESGKKTAAEAAKDILTTLKRAKTPEVPTISKEMVLKNCYYYLVNKDKNSELLNECPSIPFAGDLVKMYRFDVGEGSVVVKNKLLADLKIDPKELIEKAEQNTPVLKPCKRIRSIAGVPLDFMPILSNEASYLGAGVMAYPKALYDLAEELGNDRLVVLPSSIHEIIAIQFPGEETELNFMEDMVRDVNREQVAPEDFLSDNIFLYSKAENRVFSRNEAVL